MVSHCCFSSSFRATEQRVLSRGSLWSAGFDRVDWHVWSRAGRSVCWFRWRESQWIASKWVAISIDKLYHLKRKILIFFFYIYNSANLIQFGMFYLLWILWLMTQLKHNQCLAMISRIANANPFSKMYWFSFLVSSRISYPQVCDFEVLNWRANISQHKTEYKLCLLRSQSPYRLSWGYTYMYSFNIYTVKINVLRQRKEEWGEAKSHLCENCISIGHYITNHSIVSHSG